MSFFSNKTYILIKENDSSSSLRKSYTDNPNIQLLIVEIVQYFCLSKLFYLAFVKKNITANSKFSTINKCCNPSVKFLFHIDKKSYFFFMCQHAIQGSSKEGRAQHSQGRRYFIKGIKRKLYSIKNSMTGFVIS